MKSSLTKNNETIEFDDLCSSLGLTLVYRDRDMFQYEGHRSQDGCSGSKHHILTQ
jgi:hypothetical protein